MADKITVDKTFDGDFSVKIKHFTTNGYEIQTPTVEGNVKWETERQGTPGKLTFKVYKSENLNFQEGDMVMLTYTDDKKDTISVFTGYIFTKKRTKDNWIEVTAYDLLRYFKNKATYVYSNKRASEVIKMIAKDYGLNVGTIEDTSYVIGERVEDDQSLFDITQNALDLTLINTAKMYVMYANDNKLNLRNANSLKTDVVINKDTAEDFDYSSSIDEETYNEIELYYDNNETNRRIYYHIADPNNVKKWGRLRYTKSIQTPNRAASILSKTFRLYNQKTRKLKVTKAFGDYRCRAGASVIVQLELGDIILNNYMLIEKATHTFNKNEYRMDLTLSGISEFIV